EEDEVGGGGAGLGGAIFVRTGAVYLYQTTFASNSTQAGSQGTHAGDDNFHTYKPAEAKGSAVFADQPATIYLIGTNSFSGGSLVQGPGGPRTPCVGPAGTTATETVDICGGVVSQNSPFGITILHTGDVVRGQATFTSSLSFSTKLPFALTP